MTTLFRILPLFLVFSWGITTNLQAETYVKQVVKKKEEKKAQKTEKKSSKIFFEKFKLLPENTEGNALLIASYIAVFLGYGTMALIFFPNLLYLYSYIGELGLIINTVLFEVVGVFLGETFLKQIKSPQDKRKIWAKISLFLGFILLGSLFMFFILYLLLLPLLGY